MGKNRKRKSISAPVLDVVIVTGGRFDLLSKCLDALEREVNDIPLSVYLIDNATDAEEYRDNNHLFFKKDGSPILSIQYHNLRKEVGYSEANNLGARMGHAPLIMFLNDDVELQEGAIQKVLDTFKDETVGVVGIKLLFPPTSTSPVRPAGMVQHVGIGMNMQGNVEHPLAGWTPTNSRTCTSRDVVAVTGACLTIRRELFQKVGGFGLEYGAGTWEDIDLCFKVRSVGKRIYVNTNAVGYHYTGATTEKKKRGYPIQQNRLIFQSKWQSTGFMIWSSWEFY